MLILCLSMFILIDTIEIPTVAPVDEREIIDPILLGYLNAEFSKSRKYSKCDNDVDNYQSIVTYFWPGDLVEMECMFCRPERLIAQIPKIWRTMSIRDAFAFNSTGQEKDWVGTKEFLHINCFWMFSFFKHFVRPESHFWMDVSQFSGKTLKDLFEKSKSAFRLFSEDRPMSRFFQKDGKLTIVNPDLEVQGVYHCYEQHSDKKVEIVHFLIAMAPLTQLPCKIAERFSDIKEWSKLTYCKNLNDTYKERDVLVKLTYGDNILYHVYHDNVWRNRYFPVPAAKVIRNLDHNFGKT